MATDPFKPQSGILDMIGQGDSSFAGWLNPRRNAIMGFGAGLIGHDTAKGRMAGAAQGAMTGRQQDTAQALLMEERAQQQQALQQQTEERNQTMEWLKANYPQYASLPPAQGFQLATAAMGRAGGGSSSFSQTPVFLRDPDGNQHIAQMSSGGGILVNGEVVNSLPQGWSITARPDNFGTVDMGGYRGTFDPNTGTYGTGPAIQGSPSTNMDVQFGPNGGRVMAPATGSPEAIDAQREGQQAIDRNEQTANAANIVLDDISRAREIVMNANPLNPAVGFGSGLARGVEGSNATNLYELTQTIRGNIGFDRLQQMRESSPTGGALGNVTEQELATLQSVMGSLAQSQNEEQFLYNLDRLEQVYSGILRKASAYPNAAQFGFGGGAQQAPTPSGGPNDPLGLR